MKSDSANRRKYRQTRPMGEAMEARLVMSSHYSVPAEVQAILKSSPGFTLVRPNSPILPLESPSATATYVDPSVKLVEGKLVSIGAKDLIAPYVTLNSTGGYIKIGTGSTVQDNASLIARPNPAVGAGGIFIGDNVVIGTGATVIGPASIGLVNGAATSIGAGATIDGSIISPGAFVGVDATVGPGVTVPTGYRVLPGKDVINNAEADTPALGDVVKLTASDTSAATAKKIIADNSALASGYATLYQGNSATGGAATAGPVPSAISASGSTIYFGALNTVLGVSSEPTSTRGVTFEPATGTPSFVVSDVNPRIFAPVAPNLSYRIPARVVGAVTFLTQTAGEVFNNFGHDDSIRADEGQPIKIGSLTHLGDNVSIHAPGGSVSTATTTTVETIVQVASTGSTTITTTNTVATTPGPATATVGTTITTTTGINAAGQATTGAVSTTISTKTSNIGAITIGMNFIAGNNVSVLASASGSTTIGDNVDLDNGSIVDSSTIGTGSFIGAGAYISGSTIPAGTVVAPGEIIINNVVMGTVQP